ncbi:MAG: nuclear transport factor 2 family protein [Bacteroidota bacterium]
MQKLLLVFLLGVGLAWAPFDLSAQPTENKAMKIVRDNIEAQKQAWNRGDLEGFMDYYWKSDQLQFIGSSGLTPGWQATLDRYRQRYPDRKAMGQLEFEVLTVDQRTKKIITVAGKYVLTVENRNIVGYFLLIWEKRGKEWVIVVDATN